MLRTLTIAFTALAMAPAFAAPAAWTVDSAQSSVGFSGEHAGAPFKGVFQKWKADIKFDAADLAHSKAIVTIETASAKTGDKFQESALGEAEWLDPKGFPTATFATTAFRAVGPNKYEADGTLTIKGKATPVKLPFTVALSGASANVTATINLDRTKLNVGMKSDPKAEWVSKDIAVSLKVRATKTP